MRMSRPFASDRPAEDMSRSPDGLTAQFRARAGCEGVNDPFAFRHGRSIWVQLAEGQEASVERGAA